MAAAKRRGVGSDRRVGHGDSGRPWGRGGRQWNAYAVLKRRWEQELVHWIHCARLRPVPRAFVQFVWREPTRRRDPDNIAAGGRKLVLDALVAAGILPGDGWAAIQGWSDRFIVGDPPGVAVTLIGVPAPAPAGP
ncbi:hypothetical protein [Nitrospira sp. Kam-Ns4a]